MDIQPFHRSFWRVAQNRLNAAASHPGRFTTNSRFVEVRTGLDGGQITVRDMTLDGGKRNTLIDYTKDEWQGSLTSLVVSEAVVGPPESGDPVVRTFSAEVGHFNETELNPIRVLMVLQQAASVESH